MWQKAAAEQVDIAILPKSLETRFKGFGMGGIATARPSARGLEEKPAREIDQDSSRKTPRQDAAWLGR